MADMTLDQLIALNPSYDPANYNSNAFNARDNAEQIKTQFMTLLVAQLKNQDPMNPMDNQDFVSQLAQFSSLEQLITIGEGVEQFNGKLKYLNEGVDYIATLLTLTSNLPGKDGEDEGDASATGETAGA